MVHCVAFGCRNRSDGGTKGFFLFPKEEVMRKKWTNAMKSMRNVYGKLTPFVPSKTSRLCARHFTDDSFVHPPSVMNSVGLNLKLQLLKDAVPTIFPEIQEYKENKKPTTDSSLGPPKRKRTSYGGFEKRNRKTSVDDLIKMHDLLNKEGEQECLDDQLREEVPDKSDDRPISLTIIHHNTQRVSRASQTTEILAERPTEHKSFQIRPKIRDYGTSVEIETKETQSGTDFVEPVDKNFQFPEHQEEDDDELDDGFQDDVDDDPDWEPSESDIADMEEDEEDDENATVWHDCIEDNTDPLEEAKFIVFLSSLLELFKVCQICHSLCKTIKKKVLGSMIVIETICETGHHRLWRSQPMCANAPLGNLLAAGAVVFSGASPSKMMNFFKFTNISMIKERTFVRYQKSFIIPAVNNVWERKQAENLEKCQGRNVRVGGDARCCSPGHTAKYGSYTLMDLETGMILATELVQSNEVKNSNAMELEGMKRSLSKLEDAGICLTDITTDRHVQVRKFLRENKSEINHWFDCWHIAKSIKTKLMALSKKKGCEIVSKWTQSIANHLYFCAATSGGDGGLVEEKWLSVLNHISNKHIGHGTKFPQCLHGPVERHWIKAGCKTHKELQLLLGNKRLVSDIRKLSPVDQTSGLEAHHKVVCQFAPKFVSFSYAAMKQRINLAALHTCSNAGRAQAVTREGMLRYSVSYPKYKHGKHVVKPVMEECNYGYIRSLNQELLCLRKMYTSHKKAQEAECGTVPPPLSSTACRVLKSDAIISHKSRFQQ